MKRLIFCVVLAMLSMAVFAQWSNSSFNPTLIAGGISEQSLPKVAIASNGNTYISRFDNSSGAYKVWLKLYNAAGEPLFLDPMGVEMTGSVSDTWLTDYDLTVDQDGNAMVCFQDIRSGTNSIFVYKVSPSGTQLWGENGISLSVNASSESPDYSPVIVNTAENMTYVAWQHQSSPSQILIQKLNSMGQAEWLNPLVVSAVGASCSWPQLINTSEQSILMKYYVDSGPFWAPVRHIKVARINPSGTIDWDQPISTAGGIAAWTQIIGFGGDGSGGAVLSWHDDRDMNNMNQGYFAHISAQGTISTPPNGAYISSDTFYNQFYPIVVCDPATEESFVVMRVTDASQNQSGLIFQLFDFEGNRMQGDAGNLWQSLSSFDYNPAFAWSFGGRFYYLNTMMDSASPQEQGIQANFNTDPGFYNAWHSSPIASTPTPKFHFDFASHPDGWIIATWEDGISGYDIYAMKYYYNGNIGDFNGAPENVEATFIPPSTIHVSWEHPLFSVPISYHVQMGSILEELPGTATEYTFTDVQPGTYQIIVRAIYPGGIISPPHETIVVTVVSNQDPAIYMPEIKISPNPLNPHAEIQYGMKARGHLELSVYNLKGQKVCTLFSGISEAGDHSLRWDGRADDGKSLPSGVYYLRYLSGGKSSSKKLILIR